MVLGVRSNVTLPVVIGMASTGRSVATPTRWRWRAGNAKISINAKRANLTDPFPLTASTVVTVQFVRNPGSVVECWESGFDPPNTNNTNLFSDKIP